MARSPLWIGQVDELSSEKDAVKSELTTLLSDLQRDAEGQEKELVAARTAAAEAEAEVKAARSQGEALKERVQKSELELSKVKAEATAAQTEVLFLREAKDDALAGKEWAETSVRARGSGREGGVAGACFA